MEQSPCAGIVSREWKRTPFPIQSSIRCPFCYIGGLQPIPEFDPVGIQWGDIGNRCIYIGIYDQKGFKHFVINTLFKKINLHHHFASCHHPGNPVRRNHFTKYLVFLHLYTILLQGSVCFLKEVKWHQWEIQRDVSNLEETCTISFISTYFLLHPTNCLLGGNITALNGKSKRKNILNENEKLISFFLNYGKKSWSEGINREVFYFEKIADWYYSFVII